MFRYIGFSWKPEDLSQAAENLSAAVRKNPLAAVGLAFSAGLLLALLVRG